MLEVYADFIAKLSMNGKLLRNYPYILKLADGGMAVTFISSEIEEMIRTCSRMIVLRDGRKVGELNESELSQDQIMKAIAGGDE